MENKITWAAFYELSEIYIAPLNLIWFLFASAIAYQDFHYLNIINILLCFLDVFLFDLAVNIADDYFDYLHGKDPHFLTVTNTIGRMKLSLPAVKKLMVIMYTVSAIPGLILVYRTNYIVLILGMIGYFFGIFYTAGPKPLNATKFCELIVSGMISVFIIEVGVYIAICGQYTFTWTTFLTILLKCLPIFSFGISPTSTPIILTIELLVNLFNNSVFSSNIICRQILNELYNNDCPRLTEYFNGLPFSSVKISTSSGLLLVSSSSEA